MAMADDEGSQSTAQTKEKEPILLGRVFLVGPQQGVLVVEDSSGLLEGYAMLPHIRGGLPRVPFEAKPSHAFNSVTTAYLHRK